jgi:hypothetical protein
VRIEATMTASLSEHDDSLWRLAVPPAIWAAHLLGSYVTAAIWCAKLVERDGSLGPARVAIAAYTIVALALLAVLGWRAYRRHAHGDAPRTREFDTPADRHRFLGFATLLLVGLSALAIVYAGLVAVVMETCS